MRNLRHLFPSQQIRSRPTSFAAKASFFFVSCILLGLFFVTLHRDSVSWNPRQTEVDRVSFLDDESKADHDADVVKEPSSLSSYTSASTSTPVPLPNNGAEAHEEMVAEPGEGGPLIDWMKGIGLNNSRIPIISIADSKYILPLRNLKARLENWDRGSDLIIICLDIACTKEHSLNGYGGYISEDGAVMESVALIKFEVNLALAKSGYNFVFLDGDVYLTGSRDPFENMLPLSDDTWDVQFQYNYPCGEEDPAAAVNIGWYFSKATPATIEFYERSNATWVKDHRQWDQEVMNAVLALMERVEKTLRVNRLYDPRYAKWNCHDWQSTLFGHEEAAEDYIQEASLIHYTCVEQTLKSYFGSNFGGYADIDGYYSKPPALLAVANISGLAQSIHAQVAFAARLANATGRALIWPDAVGILQERGNNEYHYKPSFPSVRTVSYASAQAAGLEIVESRYLINRKTQTTTPALAEVILNARDIMLAGGPAALEASIQELGSPKVAIIDFSGFAHHEWMSGLTQLDSNLTDQRGQVALQSSEAEIAFRQFYDDTGMKEYAEPLLKKITLCPNANGQWPFCLAVCK